MKKNILNKRLAVILVLSLLLSLLLGIQVSFASVNNDIAYSFTVFAHCQNGQDGIPRERSTTRYDNQWKVKMTNSTEPLSTDNTITKFWLELHGGLNVSPSVAVLEDAGYYYRVSTRDGLYGVKVYLTGENNNYNGNVYSVQGYWDEETGVYPD